MILNGASVNSKCMSWLRKLFWLAMTNNVRYAPEYITSAENVDPETLSRLPYCRSLDDIIVKLSDFNLRCLQPVLKYVLDRCPDPEAEGEKV